MERTPRHSPITRFAVPGCYRIELGPRLILSGKFHWDQFLVTTPRTCWRRRQLPRNILLRGNYEDLVSVEFGLSTHCVILIYFTEFDSFARILRYSC